MAAAARHVVPRRGGGGMLQDRFRMRSADIEESRALLLELALYEPNISHCFSLLINACLTEDIDITVDGRSMKDSFRRYVNIHYHSFCAEAVKAMFIYGFVPWHPRKLASGDIVPTVLPHGTFTWNVRPLDRDARRRDAQHQDSSQQNDRHQDDRQRDRRRQDGHEERETGAKTVSGAPSRLGKARRRWDHLQVPAFDNESKLVQHQVRVTHADIPASDVFVFDVFNADLDVNRNSNVYATVPSPLSHILNDYKNLRDAQVRRSYADAWNTTARIFTSCIPPNAVSNEPTHSYLYYETGSDRGRLNQGRHYMETRHRELEHQIAQPSNHVPSLYNLPIHHRLEQLHALSPCEDLAFLLDKYKHDVCALLGIPYEVAYGRSRGGVETTGSSELNSRAFSNAVLRVCHILEQLVRDVYATIYEADVALVTVALNPMPRLDVHSMEDLKALWEMGAVTPDVTAQLSEILLLGERTNLTGRRRATTHGGEEYLANLRRITEATAPPKPDKPPPPRKKARAT
jgi:hypothetical protein